MLLCSLSFMIDSHYCPDMDAETGNDASTNDENTKAKEVEDPYPNLPDGNVCVFIRTPA
jgi:hypothetical protein